MLQLGFMPVSRDAKLCGICLTPRFRNGMSYKVFASTKKCQKCSHAHLVRSNTKYEGDRNERKTAHRLAAFSMTPAEFAERLENQGGKCAACGRTQDECGSKRFAVDHNHKCCSHSGSCGKCVRDLLCSNCNTALGLLADDPERLIALLKYAKKWNGAPVNG